MRKLLFCFQQVGGVNALLPLIESWKGKYEIVFTGRTLVCQYLEKKGYKPFMLNRLGWNSKSGFTDDKWFRQINPDILITDTIKLDRDPEEGTACRELWKISKKYGIPSIGYVDSWWAYDERFRLNGEKAPTLPDKIAVVDSIIKKEMLALAYPEDKIVITGSPCFENLFRLGNKISRKMIKEIREKMKIRTEQDNLIISYVSQPMNKMYNGKNMDETKNEWGFNEETTLMALLKSFNKIPHDRKNKIYLLVILHPEEDGGTFEHLIKQVCPWLKFNMIRNNEKSYDFICVSDLIVGIFSILLTEAVILKRPVLSVQLHLKREDMLVTNMVGATKVIRDESKLEIVIQKAVAEKAFREKLLENQKKFEIVHDSFNLWDNLIKEVVSVKGGSV